MTEQADYYRKLYDKALAIAKAKHFGQTDKSGKPYIGHPVRVAQACTTDDAKIVALLHDVIEDSDASPEYLAAEGFPPHIVEAVTAVSREDGESYDDFIRRAAANPIGLEVKIADLEDNMDVRRLNDITERDVQRLRKYLKAWRFLTEERGTR